MPTIFGYRDAVEIGELMSYGPDLIDLFKRGAGYADKIIKGAQSADLPIQPPTKFGNSSLTSAPPKRSG